MKTWRNYAGNTDTAITTWNYSTTRDWLLSKDYANASTGAAGTVGPDYTYTAGGRLKTRTWARNHSGGSRIVTTYKYGFDDGTAGNQHGDLTEISYNDSVTATVTYGYDRRGRQTSVGQGAVTTTRTFDNAGNLLGESTSGGTLTGLSVNSTYDSLLRRSTVNFKNGSTTLGSSTYDYDTASRLASVTDGTYSAAYAYLANSSLVESVTFQKSGVTKLTTQKQYDRLNRLQSIVSTPSAANQALPSYSYQYNDANQRTRLSLGDGSYWVYQYDSLGQVVSGKHYFNDGTPVPGQQYEYGFDDIGNRKTTGTKFGGDANGQNLRSASYTPNALNQYTSRTVPGGVDIMGLASAGTTPATPVTVNGVATDYRRGEYFQKNLTIANSGAAVWQSVSIVAGSASATGNVFLPQTPEAFTYDLDGNLTQDGRWVYTWDAENRLTSMESLSGAPSGSKRKLTFEYDALSRRTGKKVYVWTGSAYPASPNTTLKFLYDGWNLLGELDGANAVVRSFQWGGDLSGSLRGAGGVGGLLSIKPAGQAAQFVAYDGNGNVMALTDGTSGALTANYEYGPFGELIRSSGAQASNPVRFSSKYQDGESELVYYGYRYYNSSAGRWLASDPISEKGFRVFKKHAIWFDGHADVNLYGFVSNNSLNSVDGYGLCKPFLCGPDVGNWLEWEMRHNAASAVVATMSANNAAPFWNVVAKWRAYAQWMDLVQMGAIWDFKTFLNPSSADTPRSGNCPHEKCAGFLTLCGACYRYDIIANIHYGYVGKAAGFSDSEIAKWRGRRADRR